MREAAYQRGLRQQAKVARERQKLFDALPAAIREQLNEVPIKPDTEMVAANYWSAVASVGPERAEAWIIKSINAWLRSQIGYVAPFKPRRPRPAVRQRQSPTTHKLAPAVRTVVS
jgi:hypothetical protein